MLLVVSMLETVATLPRKATHALTESTAVGGQQVDKLQRWTLRRERKNHYLTPRRYFHASTWHNEGPVVPGNRVQKRVGLES